MKKEFETKNGSLVALSPKCYLANDGIDIKRSSKGTPKSVLLTLADFESALFERNSPQANFSQIIFNKKLGASVTKPISKRGLNSIYYKLRVDENLVDVHPLKVNEKFI